MPAPSSMMRQRMVRVRRSETFRSLEAEEKADGRSRDPEEERAVREFRRALMERDMLPPRHDDYYTMRRFLKARGFNLEKTIHMWTEMLQWRADFGADSILRDGDMASSSVDAQPEFICVGSNLYKHFTPIYSSRRLLNHAAKSVANIIMSLVAILHRFIFGNAIDHDVNSQLHHRHSLSSSIGSFTVQNPSHVSKDEIPPYLERLQKLEEMVNALNGKPTKIPPEKDHMIQESLSRIRSIEHDLRKTKDVLTATSMKQVELAESLENIKEISFERKSCWPGCKYPHYESLEGSRR